MGGERRLTEKELSQIHYINIEIETIKEDLNRLNGRSQVKGQEITGMPFGSGISDKTADSAIETAELQMLLEVTIKRLYLVRNSIERFLQTIDDPEMRLIIRLRSINDMGWQEIGDELGMSRTTASRKYKQFCKDKFAHNARP